MKYTRDEASAITQVKPDGASIRVNGRRGLTSGPAAFLRTVVVLCVLSLVAAACGSSVPESSSEAAREVDLAFADGLDADCVSGSVVAPSGMVGWWPFDLRDENENDVDAGIEISDFDGSARSDALVVGAPVNPVGKVAGALDVSAVGTWASAPVTNGGFDFGTDTDFTIDAWIKVDAAAMSQRIGGVVDGRPDDFLRRLPMVDDQLVDLVGQIEAGVANREARVDEFFDSGRAFEVGDVEADPALTADENTVEDEPTSVGSLPDDGWISDGWVIAEKGLVSNNGWAFFMTPNSCLLYTSPSPRDKRQSRMPSSA